MNLEKDILNIFELLEKQADKKMLPLLKAYKKQMNNVRNEMYTIWGKYSVNGELSISNSHRLNVMKDVEKQLVKMSKELAKLDNNVTENILLDSFKNSYYRTTYTLDKTVEFTSSFSLLKKEFIEQAVFQKYKGAMFSDRIWKNKELLVNRLNDTITNALVQGKAVDKVAKDITNTFNASAYESKRLIRTELARVVGEAQNKVYKDSDIVIEVMFSATLDGSTSAICSELDGQYFDKNKAPSIPQHPNCRSCIIAIAKDYNPTTRLDNETKENIEYKNYNEWFREKVGTR